MTDQRRTVLFLRPHAAGRSGTAAPCLRHLADAPVEQLAASHDVRAAP